MRSHIRIRAAACVGLVLIMGVWSPGPSAAREVGVSISGAFTAGVPEGDFQDQLKRTGLGGGGSIGLRFDSVPVLVGASLSYMNFGSDERDEPFSLTIPDVTVEVKTAYNIFQGHLLARVELIDRGPIRPYLDGLLGLNYLFTETKVQDEDEDDGEEIASSKNFDDTVFSYGGGGGLQIPLFRETTDEGRTIETFIDLTVRYLLGGKGQYLKKGSIEVDEGDVFYNISESKTDLLTIQLGVGLRL